MCPAVGLVHAASFDRLNATLSLSYLGLLLRLDVLFDQLDGIEIAAVGCCFEGRCQTARGKHAHAQSYGQLR